MTAPSNFVAAQGLTAISADNLNTTVQWVPTVTVLRSFIGTGNLTVILLGLNAINDGGQGVFYWNPNSLATDDNLNVIRPTGVTQGAWIRDSLSSTPVNFPTTGTVTAKCGQAYVALGAFTLDLSPSTSLSTSCEVFVYAYGGAVTITPLLNTDTINGGSVGASFTLPQGSFGTIFTDASGHFYIASTGNLFFWGGTSTGSANAQVVAPGGGFSSITGQTINFQAGFTNSGATTLDAGAGAFSVFANTAGGLSALAGGEFIVSNHYLVTFRQGTGWILLNPTLTAANILATSPATVACFQAFKISGSQALTDATATKITFNSTPINVGSHLVTNTWTPPPGYVLLTGSVCFGAAGASDSIAFIYKNGSALFSSGQHLAANATDGNSMLVTSGVDRANGTDTYELWGKITTGGGGNVIGNHGTFFTGTMI